MKKYAVINKAVGETPLAALEAYRGLHPKLADIPMAYAGRLDPMASGTLLILIGDECKVQEKYHGLDKEYVVEILFGVGSDTGDVLGLLAHEDPPQIDVRALVTALKKFRGSITLPYPHFSARPVAGKPLHVWTLEGRLDEIEIPSKTSTIYSIELTGTRVAMGREVHRCATEKIETIPEVTQASKALGADFRRVNVRNAWKMFLELHSNDQFTIATIRCVCSSGTYMRSLAEEIGTALSSKALAYSIHRTTIGRYRNLGPIGFWQKRF